MAHECNAISLKSNENEFVFLSPFLFLRSKAISMARTTIFFRCTLCHNSIQWQNALFCRHKRLWNLDKKKIESKMSCWIFTSEWLSCILSHVTYCSSIVWWMSASACAKRFPNAICDWAGQPLHLGVIVSNKVQMNMTFT